jgi:DNA repair photolyase
VLGSLATGEPSESGTQVLAGRGKREKSLLISRYENVVGADGVRRARANHHSRRKPIQCGLTIHPGNGCAYSCLYCYIVDMGFKFHKPEPCELTAEELALALLYNPNFVPGRNGTYIAIGSIVEPFQPELKALTLTYIEQVSKLGNPVQFSTKSYLTRSDAGAIAHSCDWVSPLVTILTLDGAKSKLLEPFAPSPQKRLETITNLSDVGLRPFLFLRPILPGIIEVEENMKVIDEAIHCGAKGVVLGDFRVTRRIVDAMKTRGFDVSEIKRRAKVIDDKQRTVQVQDLRDRVKSLAGGNTTVYLRSCCASADCAGLSRCVHETAKFKQKKSALGTKTVSQ